MIFFYETNETITNLALSVHEPQFAGFAITGRRGIVLNTYSSAACFLIPMLIVIILKQQTWF